MTTYLGLQNRTLRFLGGSSTTTRDFVKEFLNDAGRAWWTAHEWKERRGTAWVSTLAPYSTGTATFTQGSASVTGSGTTWTTGMTGMKMALAYGSPEYVFTRTGATTGTLDRNYVEADASASAYVLYQDRIALSTSADAVLDDEMQIHKAGYGQIGRLSRAEASMIQPLPTGAGIPDWWSLHDVSGGAQRIRVGPVAPDSIFSFRYGYLSDYTDMSGDSDECVVPEKYRKYLVLGALAQAYLLYQRPAEAQAMGAAFEARIAHEWAKRLAADGVTGQITAIDQAMGTASNRITFPVSYP